jgi:hypothetical protein
LAAQYRRLGYGRRQRAAAAGEGEQTVATAFVPVKTPDGQAELSNRQRRLGQRHRTVLLLVDGRRSEEQVRTLARQAGAPDSCFGELLEMGLILLPQPTLAMNAAPGGAASPLHVDNPLEGLAAPAASAASAAPAAADEGESELPAVRTLAPDSTLDSRGDASSSDSLLQDLDAIADASDPALEEARSILMRAVRAEAPVAGSLTLIKLRRARTRDELAQLVDEVESRIVKPYRSIAAQHTLKRVRQLLVPGNDSPMSAG